MSSIAASMARAKRSTWLVPVLWIAVTALVALGPWIGLASENWRKVILIAMLALLVSSLNLTFGYAGELSFAQVAMYAVGAYITGSLASFWINDLVLLMVISILGGLLMGFIVGLPGLRLAGWMLAIASFYVVLLLPDIISGLKQWTGGSQGLSGIPLPAVFGLQLDQRGFYVAVVVVTALWFALFRNLVVSRTGNSLAVLRHSPVLAASLGVSVPTMKLKMYTISGVPAAIAGSLFAYLDGFIAPENFSVAYAIIILAAGILGGTRSIYGAFVGAAIMQLGPLQVGAFGQYAFIAYGLFLIVAGVLLQRGIAGLLRTLADRIRARRAPVVVAKVDASDRPIELSPMHGERLVIQGVSKAFGGVSALNGVSFTVEPGEIVALIGPNGSGKTTLLNVISGYYKADAGAISIGGREVAGSRPHAIARARVARTFQTPNVADLSVRQTIASARTELDRVSLIETMLRLPRYRRAVKRDAEVVAELLDAVGLTPAADQPASSLPLGTRRLLELARSLSAQPALLLLDEVASGLDDDEIEELSRVVRAIRSAGGSILLVEHNFALVRSLADRVAVLSRGALITIESPESVAHHPEVLEHYLGQPARTLKLSEEGEK